MRTMRYSMLMKIVKMMGISIMLTVLVACMHSSGLKHSQVKMLQKEGFKLTDEGWTLALSAQVLFDFNSAEVKQENQAEIITLAKNLQKYKLPRLKIVGHTDNIGSEAYNQTLSEQRAQGVADIFVKAGYQTQNIETIGRGMLQPVVDNDTEEHRAENRRVAIIIVP